MTDDTLEFYRTFEDRFRGSRERIRQRLEVYLPFLEHLAARKPGYEALDLGCGRCEWLDLLTEKGIPVCGVDLDEGMMRSCRERGYKVSTRDALEELKSRNDNSLLAISGFHIVEHLQFSVLQSLLTEAHRALVPGGLLLLETPNPENIIVGTSNFFLDPTHLKPIPHQLLAYLVESTGFIRYTIMRLQEVEAATGNHPDIGTVLWGVGFDYSVVAQKGGDADTIAAFDELFASNRGISLNQAVEMYNRTLSAAIDPIYELSRKMDVVAKRTTELDEKILAILNSTSWKITAPLRFFTRLAKAVLKRSGKLFLATVGRLLYRVPPFRRLLQNLLRSRPELLARVSRLVSPSSGSRSRFDARARILSTLSPMEQDVFTKLVASSKKRKGQ